MSRTYDTIVLGTGGFGSSCLYHLACRGVRALGIDRFPPGHDRGSSHGETRIIRQAYFEHPDYVPLLIQAYELWRVLEAESGRDLLRLCGLLLAGPPAGETIAGACLAARQHGLRLDHVATADAAERFPGFRVPEGFDVVFEPEAGYLHVEECVTTAIERAVERGAELRTGETVVAWESDGRQVTVRTDRGTYTAGSLVVSAGAWAEGLLRDVPGLPKLRVLRKALLWHPVRSAVYDVEQGGCGFFFEMPTGAFYGFPSVDGMTLKLAEHSGGTSVDDPLQVDRELRGDDVQPVAEFIRQAMPDVDPTPARHAVCLYTMTPDSHFVVDRHPEFPNVVVAAGFSGHGFKFTSSLGWALADLATEGATPLPIGFLGLDRFRT